jgi:exosortase A-associated hydrolase 1
MFVELARALSAQGIVCLRFDVGGWGDSPGEARPFEESASDIAMAAAALAKAAGTESRAPVALWIGGLCDGATAAMLALPAVKRQAVEPAGVFLLNPWVRSDASLGEAMIRHYYAKRILDPAFWRRLFSGRVPLRNLIKEPCRYWRAASKVHAGAGTREPDDASAHGQSQPTTAPNANDLATTFIRCREAFKGQVVTVLSGNDLTAAETETLIAANPRWQRGLDSGKATVMRVAEADHTFSAEMDWALVSGWMGQRILR